MSLTGRPRSADADDQREGMVEPFRPAVLDEAQFLSYVATVLDPPTATAPQASTRLYEDLGLDSLGTYELLVAVEALGASIDEERWVQSSTLGELYHAYRSGITGRRPPSSSPGTTQPG